MFKYDLVRSMVSSYLRLLLNAVASKEDQPLIEGSFNTRGLRKIFGSLFMAFGL